MIIYLQEYNWNDMSVDSYFTISSDRMEQQESFNPIGTK